MKIGAAGAVLLLLTGGGSAAADEVLQPGWREEVGALRAGNFPPPPALEARYVFGWEGVQAADATVQLRGGRGGTWTGTVRGGTMGLARSLWKLDARYDTTVAQRDWRSVSALLTEEYRGYRVTEKMDFRRGGVRSRRVSTHRKASPPKWLNFYVDGLRDMAGALLLARSQPLRNGDRLSLAVFPGEWMYLVRVKVEGREKLRWQGEVRDTIKVSLQIDWIDKQYQLHPHKKFQRGAVWVSDDEVRMPLRLEVKVFIGSVFAELVELKAEG
jgi:hypothetical protein